MVDESSSVMANEWQSEGLPTEPGWYVVQEWMRHAPFCLYWAGVKDQRDWRRGAQKVRVTGFYGPIPVPARKARPELASE